MHFLRFLCESGTVRAAAFSSEGLGTRPRTVEAARWPHGSVRRRYDEHQLQPDQHQPQQRLPEAKMYKYASTWPALSRLLGSWANNCGLTACMPPPMTPNLADDFLSEDESSDDE